jgi:hypothetical protein
MNRAKNLKTTRLFRNILQGTVNWDNLQTEDVIRKRPVGRDGYTTALHIVAELGKIHKIPVRFLEEDNLLIRDSEGLTVTFWMHLASGERSESNIIGIYRGKKATAVSYFNEAKKIKASIVVESVVTEEVEKAVEKAIRKLEKIVTVEILEF